MVACGSPDKYPKRSQALTQCPGVLSHGDHAGLSIKRRHLSSVLSSAVTALPLSLSFHRALGSRTEFAEGVMVGKWGRKQTQFDGNLRVTYVRPPWGALSSPAL